LQIEHLNVSNVEAAASAAGVNNDTLGQCSFCFTNCMSFHLSAGIFNRELTLAAISEGGGIAKDMFVRIRTAFNGGQRVSAETFMNNEHLPIARRVRVAVLLVGELSKSKQNAHK
jgi:hypothetical protein